jgi:hypothetical protein
VRPGKLDPDVARLLSRLQKLRLDADYCAEFLFSPPGPPRRSRRPVAFV